MNKNFIVGNDTKGTVLGLCGKNICAISEEELDEYKKLLVIGNAGTGKTFNVILSYVFQLIKRGESAIINDPNGEVYARTAIAFEAAGYRVRVFNPSYPNHSDGFNALSTGNYGYEFGTLYLCKWIMSRAKEGELYKEGSEWFTPLGNDVKVLLEAIIQYVGKQEVYDRLKSIGVLYEIVANDNDLLQSLYNGVKDTYHPSEKKLAQFCQMPKKRKKYAIEKVKDLLREFDNPALRKVTEYNDLDFSLCTKEKCAYFVINDNTPVMSLLWDTAYNRIHSQKRIANKSESGIPVNFVLDEFNGFPITLQWKFPVDCDGVRTIACVQSLEDIPRQPVHFNVCMLLGGKIDDYTKDVFSTMCPATKIQSGELCSTLEAIVTMDGKSLMVFLPADNEAFMLSKRNCDIYHTLKRYSLKRYTPVRLKPIQFYSTDVNDGQPKSV